MKIDKEKKPNVNWEEDPDVFDNIDQIVRSKLTYRFHKLMAMRLDEALVKNKPSLLSEKARQCLLKKMGLDDDEWKKAFRVARKWHAQSFMNQILQTYSPTLAHESGAMFDQFVEQMVATDFYLLLEEPQIPLGEFSRLLKKTAFIRPVGRKTVATTLVTEDAVISFN